jgi:hypothetical protein
MRKQHQHFCINRPVQNQLKNQSQPGQRLMKTLPILIAFVTATSLSSLSARAVTADSSTLNIFSGASVDANSVFSSGAYSPSSVVDGLANGATSTEFFFGNTDPELLSIAGFSAPAGIDSITFFNTQAGQRAAPSVIIYTSTSDLTTDVNPADYTALNGGLAFTLPTDAGVPPSSYTEGLDSASGGADFGFDTLTGLDIPVGTQSILFDFGSPTQAAGLSEIQGFPAVPEPSTWAMMGLGAVGLLFLARRRLA